MTENLILSVRRMLWFKTSGFCIDNESKAILKA